MGICLIPILKHQLIKSFSNDPLKYNCWKGLETVASHLNRFPPIFPGGFKEKKKYNLRLEMFLARVHITCHFQFVYWCIIFDLSISQKVRLTTRFSSFTSGFSTSVVKLR